MKNRRNLPTDTCSRDPAQDREDIRTVSSSISLQERKRDKRNKEKGKHAWLYVQGHGYIYRGRWSHANEGLL